MRFFTGISTALLPVPAMAGTGGAPPAPPASQAMKDIMDIKAPLVYGMDPALVRNLAWGLAAALLLGALFLAWRLWRRKQSPGPQPEPAPQIPPEDLALGRLDALSGQNLSDKQFYFRLSEILRAYLMGRYGIGALEMTTEELLPQVARSNICDDHRQGLRRFFIHSDAVKFAGQAAAPLRRKDDIEFIRFFIQRTTPVPPPSTDDPVTTRAVATVRE